MRPSIVIKHEMHNTASAVDGADLRDHHGDARPAVGYPDTPKKPKMTVHRGLSGPNTPKMGFLLASSNQEPVCRQNVGHHA